MESEHNEVDGMKKGHQCMYEMKAASEENLQQINDIRFPVDG